MGEGILWMYKMEEAASHVKQPACMLGAFGVRARLLCGGVWVHTGFYWFLCAWPRQNSGEKRRDAEQVKWRVRCRWQSGWNFTKRREKGVSEELTNCAVASVQRIAEAPVKTGVIFSPCSLLFQSWIMHAYVLVTFALNGIYEHLMSDISCLFS